MRYVAEVAGRSSFGTVKKTASGRYRAFYTVSGVTHSAGHTFPNKVQADSWLKSEWERRRSGTWVERRPSITLRCFVDEQWWPWMTHLSDRTADGYRLVLRTWIYPAFTRPGRSSISLGDTPVAEITEDDVRAWYAASKARGREARLAKAYRLLREVLSTAVADELIARNPCVVKRAGMERSPERAMASIAEVEALAAAEAAVGGEAVANDTPVTLLIGVLLTQLQGAGMLPAATPGAMLAPGGAREGAKPALSVAEAAELLGVSRALTYELVKRGELPSVRLGRRIVVPRRAVEQLLAAASEGRRLDANGAVLHREPPAVARRPR